MSERMPRIPNSPPELPELPEPLEPLEPPELPEPPAPVRRTLSAFRALPRRRWTLRTLLVVSIVALVALLSFGIGAASIVGLNSYLENRVDVQLSQAVARSLPGRDGPGSYGSFGRTGEAEKYLGAPGLPVGTISAVVDDGAIQSAAMIAREAGASNQGLSAAQEKDLVSVIADGRARTISLGPMLGDYRVLAFPSGTGTSVVLGLPLSGVQATIGEFRGVVILISALGVLIAALASAVIVSFALRPLRRVAATATQVANLPLDRGEVSLAIRVPERDTDPRTEVGQVGAAFNGMLGHVDAALRSRQASENKVRQFVADASHELRTPLASIRGYAELTRRGGHELPPDVTHSISRVESEAVRMTSLVEDLLLLARLDEGRELEKRPVDLSRLLVDCLSDAYAAGPENEWVLEAPEEPVTISADGHRIHQVIANLLTNARVHTPEGTRVTVTLSLLPPLAVSDVAATVITVEDNGPGIAEPLRDGLFERFARGDSSRSRAAGSTGLGLSIVRAVVEAHGGTVSVDSEPGRTEFRVILPRVVNVAPSAVVRSGAVG